MSRVLYHRNAVCVYTETNAECAHRSQEIGAVQVCTALRGPFIWFCDRCPWAQAQAGQLHPPARRLAHARMGGVREQSARNKGTGTRSTNHSGRVVCGHHQASSLLGGGSRRGSSPPSPTRTGILPTSSRGPHRARLSSVRAPPTRPARREAAPPASCHVIRLAGSLVQPTSQVLELGRVGRGVAVFQPRLL